ncbi:haloacid dehalogenase type II [Burkholderia gladioli]|uniref:haloacid dehalogenase type II n=1 Tax=Burkholderia gladioli TaxID=28095 RepID=UPI001FC8BA5C|nr:haloacid dehalogenase type II [Burkholderia gladioli]
MNTRRSQPFPRLQAAHASNTADRAAQTGSGGGDAVQLSRRGLLVAGVAAALTPSASVLAQSMPAADMPVTSAPAGRNGIKALVFDVYGTCTDYWSSIVEEGRALSKARGLEIDWPAIATEWSGLMLGGFKAIFDGQRPWQSLAALRLDALESTLRRRGLDSALQADLENLNDIWQRLRTWPDVIPGLRRLHQPYLLATLSNADMADMAVLAHVRDFRWDLVMTAELARAVKPAPKVYQMAPTYLGLKPEEIMMVACHKPDLLGARGQGLRTAFIRRPLEAGPGGKVDTQPDPRFDLVADSFTELADLLGA